MSGEQSLPSPLLCWEIENNNTGSTLHAFGVKVGCFGFFFLFYTLCVDWLSSGNPCWCRKVDSPSSFKIWNRIPHYFSCCKFIWLRLWISTGLFCLVTCANLSQNDNSARVVKTIKTENSEDLQRNNFPPEKSVQGKMTRISREIEVNTSGNLY